MAQNVETKIYSRILQLSKKTRQNIVQMLHLMLDQFNQSNHDLIMFHLQLILLN